MFSNNNSGLESIINRPRPSWWSLFLKDPNRTLAKSVYSWQSQRPTPTPQQYVTVVCVSDTHNSQPAIPSGDILIHAGDLTQSGSAEELQTALDWLNSLPHLYKIVIAGNHDNVLDQKFEPQDDPRSSLRWGDILYLESSSATLKFAGGRALKIYGCPLTPKHGNWGFQYPRGEDQFSNSIPDDADIVITHGPPKFHLDLGRYGDEFLLQEIWRVRPKLHVFGHIHEGYGRHVMKFDKVQRCYENVFSGSSGLAEILLMLLLVLQQYVTGASQEMSTTTVVNASAVGGLRDQARRKPIVEYL